MPKLGLTMTEGTLASWSVKPGDLVRTGDILFIVETDKIANEVEARDDGTILTIEVAEGDTVPVGAVLATWTGPSAGGDPEAAQPAPPEPAPSTSAVASIAAAAGGPGERVFATPLARRMAHSAGIELNDVSGSGPRGRIKAIDIERFGADRVAAKATVATTPAPARPSGSFSSRPATAMERTVARRLSESKQTIPHFYVQADADVTALIALRKQLNDFDPKVRISVNHCIAAAAARGFGAMPGLNAVWRDGEIVTFADIDIGIAVDTPRGLLVPVLRDTGGLPLPLIAERADELVARARDNRLDGADLSGGALSISNVGMYGASFLAPIINPGQSAILGVGAPKQVFRPDANGQPALRQEIGLTLACDHRIHDGVRAAILLDHIVKALESPLRLLMP